MNILFAGSPHSAAKVLDSLSNESNINIKAVITQPDKRGKRGSKLIESAVANKARSLNIAMSVAIVSAEAIRQNNLFNQ